jgi:hypothetical protein
LINKPPLHLTRFGIIVVALLLALAGHLRAQSSSSLSPQESDSLLFSSDPVLAELDSILNSPDSVSILGLIDSLLALTEERSQLAVRFGYNSNVSASPNTVNINKFGLSPGISFFHKSGLYADLASYWSNQYDPGLYLTVPSAGYIFLPTTKWSILTEYSHYFYNKPDSIQGTGTTTSTPYTNNIYISNFWDGGWLTGRLDYSFLFGQKTGNRFYAAIGLDLIRKNWLGIDRIRFFPTAGLLYGNETVETQVLVFNPRPHWEERKDKPWGILNYSLSAPLTLSWKSWTFLASYTYNFPQPLPGELLDLSHSGFVTFTITRYFEM